MVPNVIDSIDGQPLITELSDLYIWNVYHQFPYHRLLLSEQQLSSVSTTTTTTTTTVRILNIITSWFLRPEIVLSTLSFYVFLSKPLMKYLRCSIFQWDSSNNKNNPASTTIPYWFHCCIIVHNALLTLFSGWIAYESIRIVSQHIVQHGLYNTYCNIQQQQQQHAHSSTTDATPAITTTTTIHNTFWYNNFGPVAVLFYLSKYYEFVDTWILVLKGKRASFLQVYHHTGIVYIMWCAVLSQSSWLLFVVVLNSIIHTCMYTYFCTKSIYPQMEISIAKYLTMAQITQFMIGIISTIPIFIYGKQCDTSSSRYALACLHFYGFGLIALFVSFAQKKYTKKQKEG